VSTLVRHASRDIEHVVVCLTTARAGASPLPTTTRTVELGKPPGNSLAFLWRLARTLRDIRPDVVHTRNWSGLDGIIAARLAGLRTVVHGEHGWSIDDPEGLSVRRLRIRRLVSRWVREYTCVSKAIERWLREVVRVRQTVFQVYNGVDTATYRPGPGGPVRRTLGISEQAFVVGSVGRLDPIKDHVTLLSAFARFRAAHPGAVLVLIGDGPERARLEAAAGPGVQLLGQRDDVAELMRAFDVFALPSLNEGINNTILEAMASGLPVVATNTGGNPELVADGVTGLLLPRRQPTEIAAALHRYLVEPELARAHATAGRERAVSAFSVGAMVRSYEAVYRRMADPDGMAAAGRPLGERSSSPPAV
jgi:sugar transferase (PEP-CTERM/EpsH1 system associated)